MAVEFYKEFGDLGYLANYSDHGFYDNGVFYKTVEHYYQANKFTDGDIRNSIISAETPKEASQIGRNPDNGRIDDFRDLKLDIMEKGVYLKFCSHKDLRTKLIDTGNEDICEMTTKENYWGVGPLKDGANHMGRILMKVRDRLKGELKEQIFENCRGKRVYVVGHRRPDIDSLVSSYILTNILKSKGIDAVYSARDTNYVEEDIKNDYLDDPYIVDDYSDKYFILVDHNVLDGISSDRVIGAFDHHRISFEVNDLIETEYSSCALLIYDLFKDEYHFSPKEKELIFLSVMSDTDFLSNRRYRDCDKSLVRSLGNFDLDELKNRYLELNDMTLDVKVNLFHDYKEYDYDNLKIKRSLIKCNQGEMNCNINKYLNSMESNGINLIIWCIYDKTGGYACYRGEVIELPYFTTSTHLVLDYLKQKKYL